MNAAERLPQSCAEEIRDFMVFADSTDLKELQDAVDSVKAIYRAMIGGSHSAGEIALAAEAQSEVLSKLMLAYNAAALAKKAEF
jgi:hypothetical protein